MGLYTRLVLYNAAARHAGGCLRYIFHAICGYEHYIALYSEIRLAIREHKLEQRKGQLS
jgi:hypothetical protein